MKLILAAMLAVMCLPAHADIITIDSDNYAAGTDISSATPGVTLSTYTNFGGQGTFAPLYVVGHASASNPEEDFDGFIGDRVFGHATNPGGAHPALFNGWMPGPWDYGGPDANYEMFRADFAQATDFVEIRSLFHDWMSDPAVMWAFDANGTFLTGCGMYGGANGFASTGSGFRGPAMTEPLNQPCGERLIAADCGPNNYYCDTVVTGRIERATRDIAYVVVSGWYGVGSTGAMVDRISYRVASVPEPGTLALMSLGALGLVARRKRKPQLALS